MKKIIYVGNPATRETVPVTFIDVPDPSTKEAANYLEFVQQRVNCPIAEITVTLCNDGKVDVSYSAKGAKFERIRRITGYLTGALTTWNNAKQSEERERVKHTGERLIFNAESNAPK